MPYIKPENRKVFEKPINEISENIISDGELNFVITSLLHKELNKRGLNYQNVNDLVGMLECAKLEFYRTVAAPYENIKMDQNGRVSNLDENFFKTQVK